MDLKKPRNKRVMRTQPSLIWKRSYALDLALATRQSSARLCTMTKKSSAMMMKRALKLR